MPLVYIVADLESLLYGDVPVITSRGWLFKIKKNFSYRFVKNINITKYTVIFS